MGKVVGDVIRFIAEVQWLKMILQKDYRLGRI
jgi:hypothetical protein